MFTDNSFTARVCSAATLILITLFLICTESAWAATYTVDAKAQPGNTTFTSLSSLLSSVTLRGGDVVKIKATGIYRDRIKFTAQHSGEPGNPVIVLCEDSARAVWDGSSTNVNDYGYLWSFFPDSHDIEVRHLEIRNVQPGPDDNNRGLQVRGRNITIRDCYIHHNPNGIFTTAEAVNTHIEQCEVAFNGTGSGYTHNFYVQGTGTYVRFNYIHDANGGMNYKDRSLNDSNGIAAEVSYNWIENAASGGYELDFSGSSSANGALQNVVLAGNIIIKSGSGNRTKVISFGNDNRQGTLRLSNNTVIAASPDNALIELLGSATAQVFNTIYYRGERLTPDGSGNGVTGSNNWLMTNTNAPGLAGTIFGQWPGFVAYDKKDFHLESSSPLLTAGLAALADALVPRYEYVRDANSQPRADGGLALGAYAAAGGTPTPVPAPTPAPAPAPAPLPVNLAANKAVTASSLYGADYSAEKGVDGAARTIWHSAVNLLQLEYLQVDLGDAAVITKLEIAFRTDQDQPSARRNFAVYASNDPEFKSGVVRLAARGSSPVVFGQTWSALVSDTQKYRYVRVTKTALDYDEYGVSYFNLAEFRVIGRR
ncbi:MAG TPA: discoidin domain-containing protein [Blastocatellia bacterium]|nr:discoidin domain-containing protein [Blastocatellia bacterium]